MDKPNEKEFSVDADKQDAVTARFAASDAASLTPYACRDDDAVRKTDYRYAFFRRQYVRDCETVLNLPQFNRYGGKTQVFSLKSNDDVSNRAYHVQLVSRIARTIGRALGLNTDLIEAVALAHDLGHAPFGHKGEKLLDAATSRRGYRFAHHVQSARYLTAVADANLSLQVVDGALCHNGELLRQSYTPDEKSTRSFADLEAKLDLAYAGRLGDDLLTPATLEGCLVRVCDVVAYLGKDRQDADKLGVRRDSDYNAGPIGVFNYEIIRNLTLDVIQNSLDKPYIALSDKAYGALQRAVAENYEHIYLSDDVLASAADEKNLGDIIAETYDFLTDDLAARNGEALRRYYLPYISPNPKTANVYFEAQKVHPERVACDFVAAMSDGYLLEFYKRVVKGALDVPQKSTYLD